MGRLRNIFINTLHKGDNDYDDDDDDDDNNSKINKCEKLVHIFGFTIEIYYDARTYEHKKYPY